MTEAERQRLVEYHSGSNIDFRAGSIDEFGFEGPPFDLIVINNVVPLLGSTARVLGALRLASAMLRPGGILVLGEVPSHPREPVVYSSVIQAWLHVKHTRGLAFALSYARFLWRRRHRWGRFVSPIGGRWSATPDRIAVLAARADLILEESSAMFDHTGDEFYLRQGRMIYRLRKGS